MKRSTGQVVRIGSGDDAYQAFVPASLPPDPPLNLTTADHDLLERANRALGKLDAMTSLLPDTSLFVYAYVRKEALVSSQIEGTQSSFSDLLLYESKQVPRCSKRLSHTYSSRPSTRSSMATADSGDS